MAFSIEQIRQARERIAPYIVRTPLIRMKQLDEKLGCEVYIKAECMQITGAFKLRGAMNRATTLTEEQLKSGIVAASSGNHGRGIAYAAKLLGCKAAIVMPHSTPKIKVEAIKALGTEVVQCDVAERFEVAEKLCAGRGAVMVPPFNDEYVMAGQGTLGLELIEQCPELNMVVTPASGGGLIAGVSTAVKAVAPNVRVYGAEPAALPRYSASFAAGELTAVPQQKTLADALLSPKPGDKCYPHVAKNVEGFAAVSDEDMLRGMKLLLTEGKLLGEPSACIGIGAALAGLLPVKPEDKVCFVISGGNVGLEQLRLLDSVEI